MGVFLFVNPENMAYRNYGKTDKKPTECLFVGNIPFDYQEEDIRDIFRSLGNLKKITMGRDRMTGRPKGHAFVEFYEIQDATEAFETLQGKEVSGRVLRLDYDAGLNRKHTGPSRGSRDGRDDRYDPYHRSSRPERSRSPRTDTRDDLPTVDMESTRDRMIVVAAVRIPLLVVTVVALLQERNLVVINPPIALPVERDWMIAVGMTIRGLPLPLNMETVVVALLLLPTRLLMSNLLAEVASSEGNELPLPLIPPTWLLP